MDLRELAQNERFASLQAAAEADGVRRQQEAEAEEAMARFDQELAAAGWSDAYDRVSGHVYYVRAPLPFCVVAARLTVCVLADSTTSTAAPPGPTRCSRSKRRLGRAPWSRRLRQH